LDHEKMAGIIPGHFHFNIAIDQSRGGGDAEACPPFNSGVIRRAVTRRFSRDGPSTCTFRFCSP
jgi:hypothetical protein